MLDIFRIFAALLVIAIHTSPLTSYSVDADFYLTRVLARVAVPFFMMVTGQFVLGKETRNVLHSIKKLGILYGISILIYLPVGIYAGHYDSLTIMSALRVVIFDGTFYHLWYFPAMILGIGIAWLLCRLKKQWVSIGIASALYIIGLGGDSYYGLICQNTFLDAVYGYGFLIWSYTRNGLFYAPLFLILGYYVGQQKKRESDKDMEALNSGLVTGNSLNCKASNDRVKYAVALMPAITGLVIEATIIRNLGWQRHDSMYVMLPVVMVFLYCLLLRLGNITRPWLRVVSTWMYILHPGVIVAVHSAANITGLHIFVDNSLLNYCTVVVLSAGAAACVAVLYRLVGKKNECRNRKKGQKIE